MRTALILFIYIASYSISWLIFVNVYYNVIKPELINYFYNRISDTWVSSAETIYNNVETLILYWVPMTLFCFFLVIIIVIAQRQLESKIYKF